MNLLETQTWLESILPGETHWTNIKASPDSPPFTVTSLLINDDGTAEPVDPANDNEEQPRGRHAKVTDGLRQTLACTADAARYSTGLTSPDGMDVRAELLAVGLARPGEMGQLVAATATMLSEEGSGRLAQPGTFLPGLGTMVNPAFTTKHGLLVVPYIWPKGVPTVTEHPDLTTADGQPVNPTHPGRMTLIAQIIMLTEQEFLHGMTHGIDSLQIRLAEGGADLRDLRRASVI